MSNLSIIARMDLQIIFKTEKKDFLRDGECSMLLISSDRQTDERIDLIRFLF